jgi:hypothetical protein
MILMARNGSRPSSPLAAPWARYGFYSCRSNSELLAKSSFYSLSFLYQGVAATKKIAKQIAAQALLEALHPPSTNTYYYDVVERYGRQAHTDYPNSNFNGATTTRASPPKKVRRSVPTNSHATPLAYATPQQSHIYAATNGNGGTGGNGNGNGQPGWERGYATFGNSQVNNGTGNGSGAWTQGYGRKNDRHVEYYGPPATSGYEEVYFSNEHEVAAPAAWSAYSPPVQQAYGAYGAGVYPTAPPRPSVPYPPARPPAYPYGPYDPRKVRV